MVILYKIKRAEPPNKTEWQRFNYCLDARTFLLLNDYIPSDEEGTWIHLWQKDHVIIMELIEDSCF